MMKMQATSFMIIMYFIVVLGVFIKSKVKNAKNITLFDCSIIPILIILIMFLAMIKTFKDSELGIMKRVIKAFRLMKVTLIGFPILITGTIYTLSNNSKIKIKRKSTNLIKLIDCISKEQNSIFSFQ